MFKNKKSFKLKLFIMSALVLRSFDFDIHGIFNNFAK